MKINGQSIIQNSTHIVIHIREPWYSAGQKYGWEGAGFGLSQELIDYALKENKKIKVICRGNYEIGPKRALSQSKTYGSMFIAKNGSPLHVIPVSAFQRLPERETIGINFDTKMRLAQAWKQAKSQLK